MGAGPHMVLSKLVNTLLNLWFLYPQSP